MSPILLWLITLVLFILGLGGVFIPGLPGIALIWLGVLFYAWATGFTAVAVATVVTLGVVAVLAWLAEYAGSGVATRVGGGKRLAFWGGLVGALVGLVLFQVPGLLLGALLGAFGGALAEGNSPARAGSIAVLAVLGTLGGKVVQLILGVAIILAFLIAVAI